MIMTLYIHIFIYSQGKEVIQKLISEMHNIKSKVRQAYTYMYTCSNEK